MLTCLRQGARAWAWTFFPTTTPVCWWSALICYRFGHYANQCYNRYDDPSPLVRPTALLHSSENSPADPNWYIDSGGTHHLTADIANLAVHSEYQEPNIVLMGNDSGLPIHSTSVSLLCYSAFSFVLKNLLHVPGIIKNLMSVSQFTTDNKVLLEYHPNSCLLKDLST